MRFSDSFLDEIRDRVPISAVIGQRVAWERKKTNASKGDWWACCPFHGEKTPSFHCEDRKGRYHCFGCGVSGDHFRFLTELDGMSFPEAVERVAEMAGVPMPARDPEAEKREEQRASLYDVMELATKFFEDKLQAPEGARARAYLRERGLTPATQQAFRLGYAPESRNALKESLAGKGVAKEEIEACGLVRHGPDIPVSYDWFRDRVMFPIPNSKGRVIAFGGRALSPDQPAKYMNSPDTELFHKGNVLYNFARARKAQGREGTIIAVEGYMDVIALSQASFGNAVAPLGTALTENQMELLWRMTGEPVLCFDGDQAGLRAAWRAADLILPAIQPGRTARFALLPEGQDPDDLVRASGPEAFRKVLDEALPLADLLWMRETQGGVFDTPERRAELEKRLRDLTGRIRDEAVRRHYNQAMRERVYEFFAPADRRGKWQPGGERKGFRRETVRETPGLTRWRQSRHADAPLRRERLIVALAANHPSLLDEFHDVFERLALRGQEEQRLRAAVLHLLGEATEADKAELRTRILASEAGDFFGRIEHELVALGDWQVKPDADILDVRDAFLNILDLHNEYGLRNGNVENMQEL
ncbi:MAG: DNA primase, partial [Rhizobiales bacterium]|nr:DNA primase [Hyphomicrobiales bacterium]